MTCDGQDDTDSRCRRQRSLRLDLAEVVRREEDEIASPGASSKEGGIGGSERAVACSRGKTTPKKRSQSLGPRAREASADEPSRAAEGGAGRCPQSTSPLFSMSSEVLVFAAIASPRRRVLEVPEEPLGEHVGASLGDQGGLASRQKDGEEDWRDDRQERLARSLRDALHDSSVCRSLRLGPLSWGRGASKGGVIKEATCGGRAMLKA